MKKFGFSCLALALAVFVGFSVTGCGKKKNKKFANAQTTVSSNGGMVARHGNTLYFVGGIEESSAINNNVTTSAIWKVEVDETGNFVSDPVVFVDSIVGFEFGSIHIFGDNLYYATPSTSKNSSGEVLSGILEFWRKPLSGGKAKKVYSTSSNEETGYQYAFYPSGEKDLFLVVYEEKAKTLVSVDIGTNPKKKTIATDVTGVVFAEAGATEGANKYVFYTHAKDKKDADQTGNVVKRVLPNGKDKTMISESKKTYSLLSIRNNMLIYSEDDIIYASTGEATLSENDKIVSMLATSAYEDIIISADHIIARDNKDNVLYISWKMGKMESFKICEADATFLCEAGGKLFFSEDSYVYSVEIKEDATALKLCSQKIETPEGNMMPEVVGNYLYFTNIADSIESLMRVNILQTETKDAVKCAK